ncbi:MAG: S-methyl-5-thioribose-1-phosphate isomerase [Verrucomicrobia bacterium]|nr:S-methyl-5-thioribose-1-phosphate isomerase [Verrucomicrobiota bacterium]
MWVRTNGTRKAFRTVAFDAERNEVVLIEQRLLPHEFRTVRTKSYQETAEAISNMTVRGAGAIGATAAYGLAQGAREFKGGPPSAFTRHMEKVYRTLANARPTAVDPVNAMRAILDRMRSSRLVGEQQRIAIEAADAFAEEDVNHCRAIGRQGAKLVRNGMKILTHCNAGWLAFVDVGSATAPLYEAQRLRRRFHVYCDETRPRCQGASLTAWELAQQGISHQVIADNAAGLLFARGQIDMVIVGSDRVLGRTGEVANKIGTYTKAVLAHRHKVPFYVAIPLSTIDWGLRSGKLIPIEERNEEEVLSAVGVGLDGRRAQVRIANPGSRAFNPGFDVTPAELITGIITPVGIIPPGELWKRRIQLM